MDEQKPAGQSSEHESPQVEEDDGQTTPSTTTEPTPASGRRQAFRDIRRQLSDEDLSSPGVQKLLLDELEQSEEKLEVLSVYIERFHQADKRAAVLEEQLRTHTAVEIAFGAGVGIGGAIIGLSPFFWEQQPCGWIAIIVGSLLMAGSTIARAVKG